MQLKYFGIASFFFACILLSCSKSKDDVKPAITIEGTWVGKYSVLSEPYNNYYSFEIKAGGSLDVINAAKQKTGTGTWKVEPNLFMATYTNLADGKKFSVLANFKTGIGKLDGTWGPDLNDYKGGYWYMNKSN